MVENGNIRPGLVEPIEVRIDNGRVFSVRQLFTGIDSGNSRSVVVSNPEGSGVNLLTVAPSFQSSAKAYPEKIINPTIDVAGTSITPRNKNISSSRTAITNAEFGGTYSGGTSRGREVIGSGAASGGVGGQLGAINLSLRIDPGDSVQYKLESRANGNDLGVSLAFIEEPTTS